MKSLHPNLAKIAVKYDEIIDSYQRREYDESTAYKFIANLCARDDNGVLWRISPLDGKWEYKLFSGKWEYGEPPVFGVEGVDVKDFSNMNNEFNIEKFEVDQDSLYPNDQLIGSTNLSKRKVKVKVYSLTNYALLFLFTILSILVVILKK